MVTLFHVPQDGTLADAVARLAPRGTIRLAGGEYRLDGALVINKPLWLAGAGLELTTISGNAAPRLVDVRTRGRVKVSGITFVKTAPPDGAGERSCVLSFECDRLEVAGCRIDAAVAGQCAPVELFGMIARNKTRGFVADCIVDNCYIGMTAADTAAVEWSGNRLTGNQTAIYLRDAAAGRVTGNRCRFSVGAGIYVEDAARPELIGNRCERNEAGIVYAGTAGGTATGNLCRSNQDTGILVQDAATPRLAGNLCEKNAANGIAYLGLAGGEALDNVCRYNRLAGILVQEEAAPALVGNRCEENDADGIAFLDYAAGSATDNTCRLNLHLGIQVMADAAPRLRGNACDNNRRNALN